MQLTYIPQFLPFLNGKTSFSLDGNKYFWKPTRLEDEIGRVLARYDAQFLETEEHVLGRLRVTAEGTKALGVDVIIITALAIWKRQEEDRLQREWKRDKAWERSSWKVPI